MGIQLLCVMKKAGMQVISKDSLIPMKTIWAIYILHLTLAIDVTNSFQPQLIDHCRHMTDDELLKYRYMISSCIFVS